MNWKYYYSIRAISDMSHMFAIFGRDTGVAAISTNRFNDK